jgi:hypothetical protein
VGSSVDNSRLLHKINHLGLRLPAAQSVCESGTDRGQIVRQGGIARFCTIRTCGYTSTFPQSRQPSFAGKPVFQDAGGVGKLVAKVFAAVPAMGRFFHLLERLV